MKENFICKGASLSVAGKSGGMTQSLEHLINRESNNLNMHNNLTYVYCAFPYNLPLPTSQPQHPFCL